jgi:hypothetical protein
MRPLSKIIIHCTATRADWWKDARTSAKVAEIKRWHVVDRGWSDIGYHFLIDRDGTVANGRSIARAGAHVAGHNTGSIGVSLFGGHGSSENDKFSDNFTPEQDMALRGLIEKLRVQYGDLSISGHNEYAAKACPGFRVSEWAANKPATSPPSKITHTPAPNGLDRPGVGFWGALAAFFASMKRNAK